MLTSDIDLALWFAQLQERLRLHQTEQDLDCVVKDMIQRQVSNPSPHYRSEWPLSQLSQELGSLWLSRVCRDLKFQMNLNFLKL